VRSEVGGREENLAIAEGRGGENGDKRTRS